MTVDVYSEDWPTLKGVMIQGTASILAKNARFRTMRDLLYEKYPQYPEQSAIGERDSVVVEVTPKHVFAWGME